MRYSITALLLLLAAFGAEAAEPSAFGAGNLQNGEPYGLTTSEKAIYRNQRSIESLEAENASLQRKINELEKTISGLRSLIEGISARSEANRVGIAALDERQSAAQNEREQLLLQSRTNSENLVAIKLVLDADVQKTEAIEAEYVRKDDYNRLVNDINAFKGELTKSFKKGSTGSSDYAALSNSALMTNAKQNFQRYFFNDAIPQFEELIRRNYKPAYSHYMIAEMWYHRKNYEKALPYYKESARRYDQASYMPKLLLHSADCMMQTGDTSNGIRFLKALRQKYPASAEAKDAEKILREHGY